MDRINFAGRWPPRCDNLFSSTKPNREKKLLADRCDFFHRFFRRAHVHKRFEINLCCKIIARYWFWSSNGRFADVSAIFTLIKLQLKNFAIYKFSSQHRHFDTLSSMNFQADTSEKSHHPSVAEFCQISCWLNLLVSFVEICRSKHINLKQFFSGSSLRVFDRAFCVLCHVSNILSADSRRLPRIINFHTRHATLSLLEKWSH